MSRAAPGLLPILLLFGAPLAAQEAQQGTPPDRIDILVRNPDGEPEFEDCSAEQEAAIISGEIVVCRRKVERIVRDRDSAQNRYAERTMDKGDLRPPDVAGPGIFRGEPTIGKLCIPGLQKCPPPPAYMIDFSALPETPPGSDADRIGRGLAPRGRDEGAPPSAGEAPISPSVSASPEAEP